MIFVEVDDEFTHIFLVRQSRRVTKEVTLEDIIHPELSDDFVPTSLYLALQFILISCTILCGII